MRRFHLSIVGLMVVVLFVSVGFAALRSASDEWAALVTMMTLAFLTLAILGVVYRRGDRRASWLGFALLGWGYMLWASEFWWEEPGMGDRPELVTTMVLEHLYDGIPSSSPSFLDHLFGFIGPRDKAIWAALHQPVSMPFESETPLEDALKYIKSVTLSPKLPDGIPIYVEPAGLQEAEQTLQSPITLNMEGVPLSRTLKQLLSQLDLSYQVKDGLLTITYAGSARVGNTLWPFLRIGHCLFGLLTGLLGAIAGRWFYASRDRGNASSPAQRDHQAGPMVSGSSPADSGRQPVN